MSNFQFGTLRSLFVGVFSFELWPGIVVFWAFLSTIRGLFEQLSCLGRKYCMASVKVKDQDCLYHFVMDYMEEQGVMTESQAVIANSRPLKEADTLHPDTQKGLVNFKNKAYRVPVKFQIDHGCHWITYDGQFLEVEHCPEAIGEMYFNSLTLRCLGRSTRPVKRFLDHCRDSVREKSLNKIDVYRQHVKAWAGWVMTTQCSARPVETISMAGQDKTNLIDDMNRYLRPGTAECYAARGIPYRRGYLFAGPPGTGKSSMAFALAGLFGLDVYILSLNDESVSDKALLDLFHELPMRCILLLEDIDATGITYSSKTASNASRASFNEDTNRVSLSGLINALDGVAAQQGRILIMTTNCKSNIDDALIRPGRIDYTVDFSLATKPTIQELFLRICTKPRRKNLESTDHEHYERSKEFSRQVPEHCFSPAEIQGYLLARMDDSQRAIDEAPAWVNSRFESHMQISSSL